MTDYTDFYSPVQNGILERLRYAMQTDFFVDKLDERVSTNESNIQKGGNYFIVAKPGTHSTVDGNIKSGQIQDMDWITQLFLYVRFQQASEMGDLLAAFRGAVEWHLMKHRFMDAVVINTHSIDGIGNVDRIRSITPAGDATYYRFNPQATTPNFMVQTLNVVIRQRVAYG